jgi:signal transduction histidine kinase
MPIEALPAATSDEVRRFGGPAHTQQALIRNAALEWVATIDAVREGVALISEGRLLRCNQSFAQLFSLDVRTCKGRSLREVLEPVLGKLGEAALDGRVVRSLAGAHFELSLRPTPSLPGGSTLTVRDVSESVRAEGLAAAVALMESSGLLLAGVCHELKNPVAALSVGLSMLELEPAPSQVQLLPQLREALDRLEFVLAGLRGLQGNEGLELQPLELHELVTRLLRIAAVEANRRAVKLNVEVPERLWVQGNGRALFQVLLNLVANALEALCDAAGPTLTLRARAVQGEVELQVEDNGPGMTALQHARAFQPFETTKAHGTGLGLFVVRRLMTAMGGSIAVASAEGCGTTMTLRLQRVGP